MGARKDGGCPAVPSSPTGILCLAWLLLASAVGKTIRYHTYEEEPPGTVIGTLADELPLKGASGVERTFRLVKAPGNGSLVRVRERDGQLSLGPERLDREQLCGPSESPCLLAFDVLSLGGPATPGASPFRLVHVELEVRDLNDHAPRFPQPAVALEVSESAAPGTRLPLPLAHDPDAGSNGLQSFSLSPGSPFGLEAQRRADGLRCAELVLLRELDREAQAGYRLELVATDGQQQEEEEEEAGWAAVSEAAPAQSLVALVSTSDSDAGANGQVRCALLPAPHQPFALQRAYDAASYLLLTTGPLDRERVAEYNLTLVAEDLGSPPAKTVRSLTVRVADENDNAPRFAKARYEVALPENNPPGAYLTTVAASDPDLGPNGKVTYRLLDNQIMGASISTYVSVDPGTGAIYALRTFNYEILKEMELSIQASDGGSPSLSTTAMVKVRVMDQNDNAPVITSPALTNGSLEIGVSSRASRESLVARIKARDADEGSSSELSFTFSEDPQQQERSLDLFAINQKTGEVTLRRSLSEEQLGQVYPLLLTVADSGLPPLSTTVVVNFLVTASLPPSSGQDSAAKPGSWEDQPLQWDVPLIVIIILAGSCTLLLVAIITIATTCNQRKKEKKVVLDEPLDTSHLEKGHEEGSTGDGALHPSSPRFDVHSFPSKSSFASPEPSPASEDIPASENSRETNSLYDSQSRLRGANAEVISHTFSCQG
ncbi:PREDICTED: protocadherin-8 [Thamnophis sirtalis]|uniref:Protocadherin-8 n=1 Tax=Thamnophis sirtalis TaxID=35019 RepID=A0A6I9X124_9SAUR|nr:PREDICTED: protocadherin-8 [Thamnophis sirtalis]